MATAPATASHIRKIYRELYHLCKENSKNLETLRVSFRRPLKESETVQDRLKEAESKLAFARMTSTGRRSRRGGQSLGGKWVYRNGERLTEQNGTLRDGNGNRVVSNWDGKNLDPESVKRHHQQLRRMGFVNNSHAKGIF